MSFLNGLSLPGRRWVRSLCLFVVVLAAGVAVGSLAFVLTHETAARPMPVVKEAVGGWRVTWSERLGALAVGD